jgi:hypothetical protein
MMTTRDELLQRLDAVVDTLKNLPASEASFGWDAPRVENWSRVFTTLRGAIAAGPPLPSEYRNVTYCRGLDMDGITYGAIFDMTVQIDVTLGKLAAEE